MRDYELTKAEQNVRLLIGRLWFDLTRSHNPSDVPLAHECKAVQDVITAEGVNFLIDQRRGLCIEVTPVTDTDNGHNTHVSSPWRGVAYRVYGLADRERPVTSAEGMQYGLGGYYGRDVRRASALLLATLRDAQAYVDARQV